MWPAFAALRHIAGLTIRRRAPKLGEHTREVLMQEFGVSVTQVDEWMAKGVVA